jgi:hypothetical protein
VILIESQAHQLLRALLNTSAPPSSPYFAANYFAANYFAANYFAT